MAARLILFLILAAAILYVLRGLFRLVVNYGAGSPPRGGRYPDAEELVQDPCCQAYILKTSAVETRIDGKTYYFCDERCLSRYLHKGTR